jgi:ligand-binding sensor domain-containing protein
MKSFTSIWAYRLIGSWAHRLISLSAYKLISLLIASFLLSSCVSLSPQQEQAKQTDLPPEIDVARVPDHTKIGENTSLTYKNVLMSNVIRDVSADETSVWIATDKGVSMLDRSTDTWRHYTKDDGLGSDNVNAVAVDDQWIWFGTDDGVSRYDVSSGDWKTFKSKDGLKGNRVFCIAVDGDYVWFGTDGGLNRYDKNIDSWAARTKEDGLSADNVTAIAITGDYIWVGTLWSGVNRYDKTTDSWNTYSKKSGLIDTEITTIAAMDNFIWFGTNKSGISLYDKTNQTFVKNYTKTDVLSSNDIRAVMADGNHIWIGTANGGAHRYIKAVDTWVRYTRDDGLASDNITCITAHKNEIWFGTYDSGVTVYDKLSSQWTQFVKADTLPSNDINEVARDAEGNLWVATAAGVARYSPEENEWTRYGKESGLTTDFATTVAANGSSVWLGTARGLATFDTVSGQWNYYTSSNGLAHDFITSLRISDHKVWIGTNKGLFYLNIDVSSSKSVVREGEAPAEPNAISSPEDFGSIDELANKAITSIAHDGNSLWIGTEEGLWKYNIGGQKAYLYTEAQGLVDNHVNTVLSWSGENIWVGTRGGISVYDSSNNAFRDMEGSSEILPGSNVAALAYDDGTKKIWIGTPGGLSSFDTRTRRWIGVGEDLNLSRTGGDNSSGRNIRSISVGEDCVWVGTASGLAEYHKSDNSWLEYKALMTREPLREDSISNIEFDGHYVWFSNWSDSHNGAIVRFDRRTNTWQWFSRETILRDAEAKSMTQIRRIVVDDDAVWFATDYGILRYDKEDNTWQHFTTEDGLADNNINHIACGDSVVWVSYWSTTQLTGAEISKYDKKSQKLETVQIQHLVYEREYVYSIAADGDDVWISLSSSGVRKINRDGKQTVYTKKDGLDQNFVEWITVDGDEIWFAHRSRGRGGGSSVTRYKKATDEWEIYSSNDVLNEDSIDRITATERYVWIIYHWSEGGVTVYDKKMDGWSTIKPRGDRHGWRSEIEDIVEDGDYMWIGTDGDGVKRFHMASGTWTTFDYSTGLLMNDVNDHSLKVDERYVWVGTRRGLSRYDKITESWTNFTKRDALADDRVFAVVADDKYVWCGTSEGLSRYDKTYDIWRNYRNGGGFYYDRDRDYSHEEREKMREMYRNSLIDDSVSALAVDNRFLWVGTREGANRYDKVTDRWDRFERDNGLPGEDISSIVVDGYDIWMGTNAGLGKFPRMSDNMNAWVSYTSGIEIRPTAMEKEYAATLVSNEVWCVDADQDYIWIGTMRGVSRYDKKKDMWITFTDEDGLPTNEIGSVRVDGQMVWFGSDDGVVTYDKDSHDWMTFSTDDGLSSDRITSIARDDKYIWFGTFDAGIIRFDKDSKAWKSYSKKDGLAHNSVFSIAVDGDQVWIGTQRGLSRYDKTKGTWTTYTKHGDSEDV